MNPRDDPITLAQFIKVSGLAGTGGQAKHLIRQGSVQVNGDIETRPGRKLIPGDRVNVDGREGIVGQAEGSP